MNDVVSQSLQKAPVATPRSARRRRVLSVLAATLLVAAGAAAYWFIAERGSVFTDNAYVGGNVVQVIPQVSGTVIAIYADETNLAKQGQQLVQLDRTDADASLKQAEAALGDAVRSVRELYANENVARTSLGMRQAEIAHARAEVDRAKADEARLAAEYERRKQLFAKGFISDENVQNAKSIYEAATAQRVAAESAVAQARAGLEQARSTLQSKQVLVDATDVARHPRVLEAAARVREAYLTLARTNVVSPVTGYVAKRNVQLGQRVSTGSALMSIIPAEQLWVDANFKESQLADVRIGQPVKLTADLYGSRVVYTGKVVGLAAGTGAAFALLPPQNATGNWIKIVQRLPVRISLDAAELQAHPLRIGLSMQARVDTHDRSGPVLAPQADASPVLATDVYSSQAKEADALIAEIVQANQGVHAQ
ncbi:MAG: EmrA/EmrK family multidrug efflux transporter periplasmic adaptor subunit [Proteobacteria bacterium]|nr:MAG: EmrA/EmrK family multidrug efflux transporter periplasmic adaptor subunit [Pseudomonadota bacterium]